MADAPTRCEAVVIEDERHRFSLEPYRDYYFIHQEIYKWGPEIVRHTRWIIETFEKHGVDLRVFVASDNYKLQKYCDLYGFEAYELEESPHNNQLYIIMRRP